MQEPGLAPNLTCPLNLPKQISDVMSPTTAFDKPLWKFYSAPHVSHTARVLPYAIRRKIFDCPSAYVVLLLSKPPGALACITPHGFFPEKIRLVTTLAKSNVFPLESATYWPHDQAVPATTLSVFTSSSRRTYPGAR